VEEKALAIASVMVKRAPKPRYGKKKQKAAKVTCSLKPDTREGWYADVPRTL
jgi:hypothetical protein